MVIDIDSKRRMRRVRLFISVMCVTTIASIAVDFGGFMLITNAVVWAIMAVECTNELKMLDLQDKR